jgi:thermostable 8-oxoguanine DNA glycosylase
MKKEEKKEYREWLEEKMAGLSLKEKRIFLEGVKVGQESFNKIFITPPPR